MSLPKELTLEIVTPDRLLIHEVVDEVEMPGVEGYLGILPGHTPLLATLKVGLLWFRKGTVKSYVAVAFGFAEVLPDRVTILAQLAEKAEDIDLPRAEAARKRAEERLAKQAPDVDFERARLALIKAVTRIEVASSSTRVHS